MKIEHIAMYVNDLEKAKDFFIKYFDANANDGYHNLSTNFKSYFLTFDDGARLEIMNKPNLKDIGSHGIEVTMDDSLDNLNFNELDAIVLPGGAPGFKNLEQCDNLMSKVVSFASNPDKLVAAICGAPSLLGHKNLVNGRKATIYPGMDQELYGAEVSHDSVVTDGNIITSRGVGTAIDFALAIVSYYQGKEAAESLAKKIVY